MAEAGFGGKAAGDGSIWLLKVPKGLSERWTSATVGADLGELEVDGSGAMRLKVPNAMPKSYELSRQDGAEYRAFQRAAPPAVKRAKVDVGGVTAVAKAKASDAPGPPPTGRILGRPDATFGLKPAQGLGYRKVCRARMVESYSSTRTTRVIETSEVPKADKAPVVAFRQNGNDDPLDLGAKGAGEKRKKVQIPRAELRSDLFKVFASVASKDVPYLTLKDVNVELADKAQPEPYLKEVLAELAVQVRVSGKIHYDLKPEYKDNTRPAHH